MAAGLEAAGVLAAGVVAEAGLAALEAGAVESLSASVPVLAGLDLEVAVELVAEASAVAAFFFLDFVVELESARSEGC